MFKLMEKIVLTFFSLNFLFNTTYTDMYMGEIFQDYTSFQDFEIQPQNAELGRF